MARTINNGSPEIEVSEDTQKGVISDVISLLQKPSLEGLVSAAVDHVAISCKHTSRVKAETPGATVVGAVLEGYLPDQIATATKVIDGAIKFGVITEKHLDDLVQNPEPLVTPIKKFLASVNKPKPSHEKGVDPSIEEGLVSHGEGEDKKVVVLDHQQ